MPEPQAAPAAGAPIGVFDSGVGGLTVLRALREALPREDFIYLGDTARLPYGTKSPETVVRYSMQCAALLLERNIGALVVACNTASAFALPALTLRYPHLPVIGVIEPGAEAAVTASSSQHIAVIGTEGTIQCGAYQNAIHERSAAARVTARPCSLFVALAEEGWTEGPVAEAIARRYLEPLFARRDPPDTLVLGCTHFPVLLPAIRAVVPAHVRIVDSAATTALAVMRRLGHAYAATGTERHEARASGPRATSAPPEPAPGSAGRIRWLATDGPERFARVGSTFFGTRLEPSVIEIVDL